jgi:hypothetical protein
VCEFGGFYFQFYSLSIIEEYIGGLFPVNGDLSNVGLSSFVMWWRMSVDDVSIMSKSTHDDDNNDNETTTKLQSTGNDLPN